ncbi:hypothetical protein AKJ09_07810 [Labilithrix luteola]|uniref:Capsular polysaccharide export system protein KpsS n=1 Tax=Labilithrix luteola TaxID=1391654 RepID=A0A0K1Q652_9BACT|nr:hypothetical protein [Labilithrix luteola]AKV01147.1 hypothetical protein AKJ09_07810 [Labilithrix luteola]
MHFDFVFPVLNDVPNQLWFTDTKKKTKAGERSWLEARPVSELDFFINIGEELQRRGKTVAFIATTPRIQQRLRERFEEVFYAYEGLVRRRAVPAQEVWELERTYRIGSLRGWVYAERAYDWALDYDDLLPRAVHLLRYMDRFVTEHSVGVFINNIGGELIRRAMAAVGAVHGVENLIFDFVALPQRFGLTNEETGLRLPLAPEQASEEDLAWARGYLGELRGRRKPWMPASPLGFERGNFERAFAAVAATPYQKDVSIRRLLGERARRVARRIAGSALWEQVRPGERYVFFPVHLPNDTVVTLRAPQFQRQDELVQFIAERALPADTKLYVKPHIGARDSFPIDFLTKIRRLPNVRLVAPATNPHDLIEKALVTIVINSTAGFESIVHERPTVVLGKPWYAHQGLTVDVARLDDLPGAMEQALSFRPPVDRLLHFLAHYRNMTYEGTYGWADPENVAKLASVLVARLDLRSQPVAAVAS